MRVKTKGVDTGQSMAWCLLNERIVWKGALLEVRERMQKEKKEKERMSFVVVAGEKDRLTKRQRRALL